GRGLGTYSMKLLGEEFLGGKVAFSSTEEKGTEFTITLASSNS
ncbi:MAG: ATP-binding protein, partial [Proteobacteria bacterium]|nr:ATP-binding protein [Pseudomonadota bacterium]